VVVVVVLLQQPCGLPQLNSKRSRSCSCTHLACFFTPTDTHAHAVHTQRRYGRLRMQCYGFLAMFVLFTICGAAFPVLLASQSGLQAFQALYFLSSFFNQVGGVHCTGLDTPSSSVN
jgi:hypothetical protein